MNNSSQVDDQIMRETCAGSPSDFKDDPEAFWVKWRGKWQTCIRCPRADYPLSTLKAKPKHDRKQYTVVFFPNSKTYSWVDIHLLHPIDIMPPSLSPDTLDTWMALVKDLTLPRRHMMQKLALFMLDFSDQLHTGAVIESARRAAAWKMFAKEASFCREYRELGLMLLKLYSMILPKYIKSDWSENSWINKCREVQTAENIELLTEELVDSVQWSDVDKLWSAPVQPKLGPEWRTMKQEIMKNFFTTLSVDKSKSAINAEKEKPLSSKDIKSDMITSDNENDDVPDNNLFNKRRMCMGFVEAKGKPCSRWANVGENYCNAHRGSQSNSKDPINGKVEEGSGKLRKCSGFVEAKGRNCERWANEGDIYCSVHQSNHLSGRDSELDKLSPMCEGTTVHGKKCKHHASSGSGFCKKHHIRVTSSEMLSGSKDSKEKLIEERKFMEEESDLGQCIGHGDETCVENASSFTLYCQRHVPKFLMGAQNDSRIFSKETFVFILRSCLSRKDKVLLHRASELLYSYMMARLSNSKPDLSQEGLMDLVLSEADKDRSVGVYLRKLVSYEREKIIRVHGLGANEILVEGLKCKMCDGVFPDDKLLRAHCVEAHKKEALWLFTGYACTICRSPFTNRKVLEAHVRERHGAELLDNSLLFRCMACNSSFPNSGDLWAHVLACHSSEFSHPDSKNVVESFRGNDALENENGSRRYGCRFCGARFDLLPDLGRHHQAAHKHEKIIRSRFKRGLGPMRPAKGFKKLRKFRMTKCAKAISSAVSSRLKEQALASQESELKKLTESDCSRVANFLVSEMKRAKARPCNSEILTVAKSACCRTDLQAILGRKYGTLPRNLYLIAAKLCSEANFPVNWHTEGFICPKGCNSLGQSQANFLSPLIPLANKPEEINDIFLPDPQKFIFSSVQKIVTLCKDISFGLEPIPVPCVVDKSIINEQLPTSSSGSFHLQALGFAMPWLGFSYTTKRVLDPALGLDTTSSQLGCACTGAKCSPDVCDHVYLFDNDYEDAEDVHGNSMHGRFPYDEMGRIVVEEGCLVYECNSLCSCDKACQNRILQNGLQVKLEVFRTEKKGWAVRAAEPISRGRFICEYIGEVLNDVEATRRGERYDIEGCSYLYDIDAHIDDNDGRMYDGKMPFVIDATKYGNVARFINHSCSPNLVNYQVLIESMDCQLAHIGLYAVRDIQQGEELSYDYRYKLLPGAGCLCHCGAPNCRGRLY